MLKQYYSVQLKTLMPNYFKIHFVVLLEGERLALWVSPLHHPSVGGKVGRRENTKV